MIATSSLRRKLLDLAITGRLCRSAECRVRSAECKDRVEAEKCRESFTTDCTDGRARTPAAPSAGMAASMMPPLPPGWKMVKLEDVCSSITDGDHHPPPKSKTGIPFLVISNIAGGTIDFTDTRFVDESYYRLLSENRVARKGDILITVTASYGIAVPVDTERDFCFQRHIAVLKPRGIDRDYLVYALQSTPCQKYFDSVATGTAQKTVGLAPLRLTPIPLPPLAEQKAIVKRLEELLALEREIAADSTAVDDLVVNAKRKILELAVAGKLVQRQGDWESVQLGDVCDYGKCIGVDPDELDPESWVLDLEDIEKDTGSLLVRVSAKDRKSSSTKHAFKQGTLLYSKLRTYLNKVLIAPEDGCCTSEILPLVFDGRVVPSYARIVLMSPMFLDYTAKCCYGVKMPRLGTADGRKGPFPLPPLAEQRAIVAKVDELFSVLDAMKGSQK